MAEILKPRKDGKTYIALVTMSPGILSALTASVNNEDGLRHINMRFPSKVRLNDLQEVKEILPHNCVVDLHFVPTVIGHWDTLSSDNASNLASSLDNYDLVVDLNLAFGIELQNKDERFLELVSCGEIIRPRDFQLLRHYYGRRVNGSIGINSFSVGDISKLAHWAPLEPGMCVPKQRMLKSDFFHTEKLAFSEEKNEEFDVHQLSVEWIRMIERRGRDSLREEIGGIHIINSLFHTLSRGYNDYNLSSPFTMWSIPVLSTADGSLVMHHNSYEDYLSQCRTMIITELQNFTR